MLLGAAGVVILAAALWFGVPWVQMALDTVSTDDAYVNGHVTFVAARVRGQVARVLVDDNYRVHKGELLVQLDKEPLQIAVAIKKAAVEYCNDRPASGDSQSTRHRSGGHGAGVGSWSTPIEDVDNQVALLRAKVAGLDKSEAELALAQVDFDRAAQLVVTNDMFPGRSTTGGKPSCWRPARTLSRRVPMFGKSAPPWDYRRKPTGKISAKSRLISIKPFLPSSRRRPP